MAEIDKAETNSLLLEEYLHGIQSALPPTVTIEPTLDSLLHDGEVSFVFKIMFKGKDAVLKILKPSSMVSSRIDMDAVKTDFQKEAFLQCLLAETFPEKVVNVLYYNSNGLDYILFEQMGPEIDTRQLDTISALAYFMQAARAVADIHYAGVVHRDIKWQNFLTYNKDTSKIKLTDFGIALYIGTSSGSHQPIISEGTPLYMSPEQIRNDPIDQRADIWSLGVMLYEALTKGRLPVCGHDEAELELERAFESLEGIETSAMPIERRFAETKKAQKTIRELNSRIALMTLEPAKHPFVPLSNYTNGLPDNLVARLERLCKWAMGWNDTQREWRLEDRCGNAEKIDTEFSKINTSYTFDELVKLIKQEPDSATQQFSNIGLFYMSMNMFEDAFIAFKKAIKLNQGNYQAYNNLGVVFTQKNNKEKAAEYFKKALQANPEDLVALRNLKKAS